MATQLPFDMGAEQSSIDRQQMLAQALMKMAFSGQPQGQMVSGHYVAPSILSNLLPIGQALLSRKMSADADRAGADLSGKYNSKLAEGLQRYFSTREGTPGEPMGPEAPDGSMGAPVGAVAGDPRKAAIEALTSGMGPLQQVGQTDLAQIGRQGASMSQKDLLGLSGFDPQSRIAAALSGKVESLQPERKDQVVNNQIFSRSPEGAYKSVLDARDPKEQWSEPYPMAGADGRPDLYRKNLTTGKVEKIDNSANVRVNATPNITVNGQKAGMEAWSKEAAKTVSELATDARGAVKLLGSLNQLEASGQAGVFSGPTATPAVFITGLGKALGVPVDEGKLANSQAFNSASITAWQDLIKQAGGNRGVVKEEAERIAQIVPQLSQSPQGRKQILSYLREISQQVVKDARQSQQEYGKALQTDNPAAFTFGLGAAELPRETPTTAPAGSLSPAGQQPVMSLDEYIRSKQRR